MNVASLAGVRYRYPQRERDVLADVNWNIEPGTLTLVVGPSGGGKTTLLRCLNGLIPHFQGGHFGGQVIVAGLNTREHATRDLAPAVAFVFQDPEAQVLTDRVVDELTIGMELLGRPKAQIAERLESVVKQLNLQHLREREMSTLSGGERQRVLIAAALMHAPQLLVLDEPTSQLDPIAAMEVLDEICSIKEQTGCAIVISEHRLDRVMPFADRMLLFTDSGIVEGSTSDVLPLLNDPPPLIALGRELGWDPLPTTIDAARPLLPKIAMPPATASTQSEPVLEVEHLTYSYGDEPALNDISFTAGRGEIVALIGRNGSGKTTLLRQLNGLLRPDLGRITVDGTTTDAASVQQLARRVGYVPQHPTSILHQETLLAELQFTSRALGREHDPQPLLELLGLWQLRNAHPLDLSGGERQRAAMAALAVGEPDILVLDEPTRGLPAHDKRILGRFARQYANAGRLVLVATHDVEFVAEFADRVLVLEAGLLVGDGHPRQILPRYREFQPQMNQLFGGEILTVADVFTGLGRA